MPAEPPHESVALTRRSEGTHAKYHYLICGVQGDFTRSLVNDPPKTLWTRESAGACPTSLSFSFTLPSTFSDKKAEYPLPPTFEAHLSGVPGFYANISYTVSAVLKQSKVSFFGLTNP